MPEEEVDKVEQMAVEDMDKVDTAQVDTGQAQGDTEAVDIASKDNDQHDYPSSHPSGQAA